MLQNTIEEMNNIISQPSINSIANEYYYDKIKNRIDLDLVDSFVLESDFKNAIIDISDMKETDIKIKGHRRLEQGYLRRHLFSRKKSIPAESVILSTRWNFYLLLTQRNVLNVLKM